jgi:hypothetical protein
VPVLQGSGIGAENVALIATPIFLGLVGGGAAADASHAGAPRLAIRTAINANLDIIYSPVAREQEVYGDLAGKCVR